MKGSHKILLALLFVAMLLSYGCKPKDCHEDGTCAADNRVFPLGEAKKYLCFNQGSYWIYKNTKTGDLDTQACEGYLLDNIVVKGTFNHTKHITVRYEYMSRVISSSFNDCYYYDVTAGYNPDAIRQLKTIVDRNSSKIGSIKAFFYPFVLNEKLGNGSSNSIFIGLDSTLLIQGKTYYNVAKFELDKDDIWEEKMNCTRANSVYYWAKDVGLIKKEMKSCNYSWELIDYNIIK